MFIIDFNELLLNIHDLSEQSYNSIRSESYRILRNYILKRNLSLYLVDIDEIINTVLAQFKDRYKLEYKTKPITFYYIILTRRFNEEYVKRVKDIKTFTHVETLEYIEIYDDDNTLERDIRDLKTVNDKHKDVMILASRGLTYDEIAKQKGISRQRVNQMLKNLSKNNEVKRLFH